LEVFDTICCVLLAQYADYEKLIKTFVAQTNKQGSILVFMVEDDKLQLVVEKDINGAVYNLNEVHGMLLAGVNHELQLYKWRIIENNFWELQFVLHHPLNMLALYMQLHGDFIVVGDLMKSMSLLTYKVFSLSIYFISACHAKHL
jgi:DNA damage-binding protein 1